MTKHLVIHLQDVRSLKYESMIKIKIPENLAEKLTSHMKHTYGPHSTNPHSDSSYSYIFFSLPTLSTFQNTHTYRNYRTQDHGAGGSPIGSLTTICTNIPAITVTVLSIAL